MSGEPSPIPPSAPLQPAGVVVAQAEKPKTAGKKPANTSLVNKPPVIESFNSYPSLFVYGYGSGTATLMVKASDPENDPLTFTFDVNGQKTTINSPYGNLYAPQKPGKYKVTVIVNDGYNKTSKQIEITVVDPKDINKKLTGKGVIGLSFHKIYADDEISKLPPDQKPDYFKKKTIDEIIKSPYVYYFSFEEFKKMVISLEKEGYQIIPLSTLVDAIYAQSDVKIPQKAVYISFDDGSKSQYQTVEWLAKRGHPSTLFIIGARLLGDEKRSLTSQQIHKLTSFKGRDGKPLVEIACHSANHTYPSLGFNPEEAHSQERVQKYVKRIVFELNAGRKILEKLLGIPISGFAAPFGEGFRKEQVTDRVMFPLLKEQMISAGLRYNRTAHWRQVNWTNLADPYMLSTFMPLCTADSAEMMWNIRENSGTKSIKVDEIDAEIAKMTLEEKANLIAFTGIGYWTTDRAVTGLEGDGFRTFGIYGTTNKDINMQKAIRRIQRTFKSSLIVSLSQEGGFVNRISWSSSFKRLALSIIAKKGNVSAAKEAGEITGEELKLYGVNLNFAPVLDLHSSISGRRISDDPQTIAEYGKAYMKGLLQAGVGACAKHFPDSAPANLGDPHNKVIRYDISQNELFVSERYQPLIDAGLPAIMMSHVIFPQVDPDNPASLSKIWISDILRGQMGFQGLVITDDLGMRGIGGLKIPGEEIIIKAFLSGADLILGSPQNSRLVKKALIDGVKSGKISEERLNQSVRRILAFSKKFPIAPPPDNNTLVNSENALIKRAEILYILYPEKAGKTGAESTWEEPQVFGGCQKSQDKTFRCVGNAKNWYLGGMWARLGQIEPFSGIIINVSGRAGRVRIELQGGDGKTYSYYRSAEEFARNPYIAFKDFRGEIEYQPKGAVFKKEVGVEAIQIIGIGESENSWIDFVIKNIKLANVSPKLK